MNKTAIKNFAVWARVNLLEAVKLKAFEYEIKEGEKLVAGLDAVGGRPLSGAEKQQRNRLIAQIRAKGYGQTMEEAAYTWFNRFIALRYMEVNGYLPGRVRVFSNEAGEFKPDILSEAMHVELDGLDRETVFHLLDAQDNEGLYKYLLITQCNALSDSLPRMFEKIANWTELLFPNNLLKPDSVLGRMVADIPEEDWTDQVQIIGWLYQYYNTELKDDTFAKLKKNVKISKERIPAATQLFTPDWIVRYMVENSLGRLYISEQCFVASGQSEQERIAQEKAIAEKMGWKYYLPEAEQSPEVRTQLNQLSTDHFPLTTIKLIDPCMGSGHILVYAFDVLMQIYEANGYNQRDAVRSILENNLYGLDIDDRCSQLAYFAVMMKARSYDRRIFSRGIQPKVYAIAESNGVSQAAVDYFCNGDSKLNANLTKVMEQMRDAKEYGSILNVTGVDFAALNARFDEIREDIHILRQFALEELLPMVQCAELLAQKYHVVVTNPPYMGGSGMGNKLSEFVKKNYPDSKSDLFSCFIERGFQIVNKTGFVSMITMESWMFLSSFEKMRQNIINVNTIVNMVHMPYLGKGGTSLGINFGTAAVVFNKNCWKDYNAQYDYICYYETDDEGVPFAFPTINERYKTTKASNFSQIPGSPVAYWVSKNFITMFENSNLSENGFSFQGIITGDVNYFLRLWHEVSICSITFGENTSEVLKNSQTYYPYIKGGEARKWYGNLNYVLKWEDNGTNLVRSRTENRNYFFKPGITWSLITTSNMSFRWFDSGFLCDVSGSSYFTNNPEDAAYVLAFLNSAVSTEIINVINPTINLNIKDVMLMPLRIKCKDNVEKKSLYCISLEKNDWDSFETSWDFKRNPLV